MDVACAPYPAGGSDYFSPLKVYEYLAAGLPVVASAVGQIPAALDHGRLGRLVRPGDAAALTAALAALRDRPRPSSALAGVRPAGGVGPAHLERGGASGCSPTTRVRGPPDG